MTKYSEVSIRTINAFLRKKGIDPKEFAGTATPKTIRKLTRKEKTRIEEIASTGAKVLAYIKGNKYIIKDANKPFNLERPEVREKAKEVRNGQMEVPLS